MVIISDSEDDKTADSPLRKGTSPREGSSVGKRATRGSPMRAIGSPMNHFCCPKLLSSFGDGSPLTDAC
jgi:hypothetical protein